MIPDHMIGYKYHLTLTAGLWSVSTTGWSTRNTYQTVPATLIAGRKKHVWRHHTGKTIKACVPVAMCLEQLVRAMPRQPRPSVSWTAVVLQLWQSMAYQRQLSRRLVFTTGQSCPWTSQQISPPLQSPLYSKSATAFAMYSLKCPPLLPLRLESSPRHL